MLRVPTPQAGIAVDRHEAVHVPKPVMHAPAILAGSTRPALAAREEHLHGDAVALAHPPPLRRVRSNGLEHTDRFVPWNEAVSREELARVLLVIRAAKAARLHAQERVVVADPWERERPRPESARLL